MARMVLLLIALLLPVSSGLAAVEGTNCSAEPTDMTITYGSLILCDIAPAQDTDIFRFQGTTGEVIRIVAANRSVGVGAPCIAVTAPGNVVVTSGQCSVNGPVVELKLTATGSYSIQISEFVNDAAVSYTLALERLSAPPSPNVQSIGFSQSINEDISPLGDQDLYQFTGKPGDIVRVSATANSNNPCIDVRDPAGTSIGSGCSVNGPVATITLAASGTFTVLVYEFINDATMNYGVRVECISGNCGTAVPLYTKIAIFRGGLLAFDTNGNALFDGPTIDTLGAFGQQNDIPVVGDWDASGKTRVGVFRDGSWFLDLNGNGLWDGPVTDRAGVFGQAGDQPIVGDWDGSGRSKVGVFRKGEWFFDMNGNLQWDGPSVDRAGSFGIAGDVPLVGRW